MTVTTAGASAAAAAVRRFSNGADADDVKAALCDQVAGLRLAASPAAAAGSAAVHINQDGGPVKPAANKAAVVPAAAADADANSSVAPPSVPAELPAPTAAPLLPSLDLEGVAALIKSGRARRIVVMAGAGISVSAGIPDFRTPGERQCHAAWRFAWRMAHGAQCMARMRMEEGRQSVSWPFRSLASHTPTLPQPPCLDPPLKTPNAKRQHNNKQAPACTRSSRATACRTPKPSSRSTFSAATRSRSTRSRG